LLGLALLAGGCGKSGTPKTEAPAGRPAADEAKACIVAYLGQCGWKDVELTRVADHPDVPPAAKAAGEAWAYSFSAAYTDVVGDRRTSENWVAVVTRADGKPCVTSCFDEASRQVGGHTGAEVADRGARGGEAVPGIVAPRP
jgi:hypothetical protein